MYNTSTIELVDGRVPTYSEKVDLLDQYIGVYVRGKKVTRFLSRSNFHLRNLLLILCRFGYDTRRNCNMA